MGGWSYQVSSVIRLLLVNMKYVALVAYLSVFVLSMVSILLAPFFADWRYRLALVAMLILGYAFDHFILDITGSHFDVRLARVILSEAQSEVVLNPYYYDIAANVLRAIGLIVVLSLPCSRCVVPASWLCIPLSALITVASVMVYTKGATQEFPPSF